MISGASNLRLITNQDLTPTARLGITIYDDLVSMESIAFKHYRPEVTRERTMACVFLHELGQTERGQVLISD